MACNKISKKTVERVQEMEVRFDSLSRHISALKEALAEGGMKEDFAILQDYMDSGQWLKDFEADEKGKLPASLKRGVLSEDVLYDLLVQARELLLKINW